MSEPSYEELFTRNIGFVDENEQALLRTARIAVLGVGGMGGVVAQILARAGVGELRILDKDTFEPANNNRQCYARTDTWGRPKVEVTHEELLRINPALVVRTADHWGADVAAEMLDGCHVVVNGMDELEACLRLWRGCRERRIPIVDAYGAPLPNVYVIRPAGPGYPGDPLPEEFLGWPTPGVAPEDAHVHADECKLREALHVLVHTRSLRYLDMQIIQEVLDGRRKRISFAPMVWGAGLLMAWEALKLRIGRGSIAGPYGRFLDPWTGTMKDARGFVPGELALIRKAWGMFGA